MPTVPEENTKSKSIQISSQDDISAHTFSVSNELSAKGMPSASMIGITILNWYSYMSSLFFFLGFAATNLSRTTRASGERMRKASTSPRFLHEIVISGESL